MQGADQSGPGLPPRLVLFLAALLGSGAAPPEKPTDFSNKFSHETHLAELRPAKDRKLVCADCHGKTASSAPGLEALCSGVEVTRPAHDRCLGCHPTAFFKKPLTICRHCHEEVRFDAKPPLLPQGRRGAPLGVELSHKLHLDAAERTRARFKLAADCVSCHRVTAKGARILKPRHAECCACHTKPDVEPSMAECARCHVRAPEAPRSLSSVVRGFRHDNHQVDPRTSRTLDCANCHQTATRAAKLVTIRPPPMEACIECHAGQVAFSYAQCLKCHDAKVAAQPAPPTHPKR